jgi:hypothetical protein
MMFRAPVEKDSIEHEKRMRIRILPSNRNLLVRRKMLYQREGISYVFCIMHDKTYHTFRVVSEEIASHQQVVGMR